MDFVNVTLKMEVDPDSQKLISDDLAITLLNIFKSWANGFICMFGIGTNILNVIVFLKQGWGEVTNVSLFTLAIADLGCLFSTFIKSIMYNPFLNNADIHFDGRSIVFFLCGMPKYYFAMSASCITAYITLERCLCISMPFKFKSMITQKRSAMVSIIIYLSCVVLYTPVYATGKFDYIWYPKKNRTLMRIVFNDKQATIDSVVFGITTVLTVGTFLFVVCCTIILVSNLWKQRKWREATSQSTATDTTGQKDRKLVKMIIVISTMYIVCFLPGTIRKCAMSAVPSLAKGGIHGNLRHVISSFTDITESINSSMNIFVYYHMSTKFRAIFRRSFCCDKEIKV